MAYEYLEKLFGEPKEGEEPKKMSYDELVAAINAASDLQLVNLKDGGYVSKDKLDSKITELNGVKAQLSAANEQIQGFKGKDTDVDAANQKVTEWEEKYKTDTAALQKKLDDQARSHAEDMFLSGYKFTSKAARKGVLDDFRAQNFTLGEDGVFKGGKEYMDSLMKEEDYKGAFVVEEPETDEKEKQNEPEPQQNNPYFARGASGTQPGEGSTGKTFNFGFTHLHQTPKSE